MRNSSAQCIGVTSSFTIDQTFFCGTGPYNLNFTNTTTGSTPGSTSFEWFEDGVSFDNTNNVGQTTTTSITNPGTYSFILVADDTGENCTDTSFVSVTIAPSPISNFTFTPDGGCAYSDVDFTNTSSGNYGGTSYSWNFGDGNTSTNTNPTNSYSSGGTYNVTLTVNNGPGCTSSITQTVTVIDAPTPSIGADDGDGNSVYCLFPGDNTTSETVTFSNTTTGGVSYEWDFGDGTPTYTTNSLADFTHDYTSYGTFTATMTATGPNGCQTTTTVVIVFEKFVSAALTLDITEYSGCAPHTMSTLSNLSVNATDYVWDFGDGTIITTNSPTPPSYAYSSNGSYTITLTASNSCNTATATISPIIIIDGPTANFNSSVTNGCAPQNISFANSSVNTQPANNYQWDMGNGNTYTNVTTPPIQTYPNIGSYTIEMIAGNACGNDTIIHTVFIDTIPTVDLILDPISGCSPLNVDPTATLLTGLNVNWQWYVDGVYYSNTPNDIANQNFVSLNPNDSTLHTIQVNVSNICGNDFDLDSVYVNPPVIANFTTLDTICFGDLSVFTNTSTGTELTYSWDFGDGSPVTNDTSTTHTYTSAGNYTVTLTTSGICGVDIFTFEIDVLPIPVIDILPNPLMLCSGESVTFTNNSSTDGTYYWDFGPNASIPSSTSFDPGAITFTGLGTQTISFAINYAGCINSDTVYIDVNPIPIPTFTVTPPTGCTPLPVSFTNNTIDTPGNMYNWTYGNGNSNTSYTPNDQTYLSGIGDSIYTVQLIVQSAVGCIDSISQTVTVHPLPIADFTILEDTLCLGDAMLFANNSTGSLTYEWDFGDGNTSTSISPGYTYSSNGDFQIMLVAFTAFGCSDTVYADIYIDSIPTASFNNTIECFGNITSFTNTSTGSPVSYSWDFGDGSPLDNTISPTHLYGASGSYLVSLTVTNSVNCSNTLPQIVLVNNVPIADLNWSQTCDGQLMNFSDASLNSPIGWAWDFGDGTTSLIQNPSHLYADTGSYNVHYVVSGGSGCLDSIDYVVYVDSIPTADFSFINVCTNDVTSFTDNSTFSPDTYFWQFGDGNISTAINPTNTYTSTGTYPVTLIVEYALSGCTHSITQDIEAYPRTAPAFVANTPCLGENTNFIDQTTNTPISWEWDFGDGSAISTVQNPTHLYSTQGLYTITLITANAFGCSDTLIQQIEIYGLPTADFTFNTVCQGANTIFTDNSIDDVSWQWTFGDGNSSLNENPTHVFATNGTYTTQLVVFNNVGCSDTVNFSITVNPNPVAGFYADTACFSYQTSFIDTSVNAVSWFYDFGDLTNSSSSNPTHIYPSDITYPVEQIVTNVFGCMDSTTTNVLVYPQPQAGFTNNIVCALDVVGFTDTTIGTLSYWEWDFGDGSPISNIQNPTNTYTTGGLYDVTLISGNTSGCLDTTVVTIEVYTNPIPNFEADTVCFLDITSFTDLSVDAVPIVAWDYDFGDNINLSALQNPTYIYQAPGTYPVTLTATNIYGCNSSITIDVIVNNIPVAEFDYDTVCWGSPTNFSDISTGSVNSWNWDFGDGIGTSTSGPNISYTYPVSGTYIASMEVDGGAGCTDIMYHIISVIDVLTPAIGSPDTVCIMESFQFFDQSVVTSGTITGWNWDFGDGNTSNLQDPIHAYANAGVYNVTLDVTTSSGCTNTGTYTVTVFDPPTNLFDFTIPCEGQPTIFTDLSSDNNGTVDYWEWDFGDGSALEYVQNPQHLYVTAGTYPVTLIIASSNGCYDTLTQNVTIYPSPTADFISGLECGGVPVDLVSTSIGNIVSYEWIFEGNTISTLENPTYTFPTDTDTHPVTLVVTTNLGCIDSITLDVVTRPVVLFDFGPFETAGCPVMEVSFFENSITTSGGGIINWLWDMGDGSYSFQSNPTHFYEDEGTYTVSLQVITAEDCIYSDTLAYSIIVYPQPIAGFTYSPIDINILDPEVDFNNTSIGAQDAEWYFGDFDYSNEWDPSHLYTDTGYYEVTQMVYNEYGCSDTAYQTLYINGTFVVYIPNSFTPNNDGLNDLFFISGYGIQSFELLIFNRWGNLIKTITDINDTWDGVFAGTACQDGVYTWKLRAIDDDDIPHDKVGHVTLIH